ncbi:MAG: GTPase ObgE, partial [Polyangiaceae bacterium]
PQAGAAGKRVCDMRFVDECRIKVVAGNGGDGVVAFRREKFVPFGGPAGGDGGRGGDVILRGDEGLSTLLDVAYARAIEAERGQHGQGSDCYGRGGEDRLVRVPVGTQIFDVESGELVADVTAHDQRVTVAKGGKGGRGNIHFATPHDRAPRRAEKGTPGEVRELRLELKIMADVGLLGFPNAGKSTFVAAVSAARPKIADYPFTTLTPSLGVVAVGGGARAGGTHFVVADIPGLIPGASEGIGLGIRFLKHVERTRALLHLVTLDPGDGREPLADYRALRDELEKFSPDLAARPEVVALSKADLPDVREAHPALAARFAKIGVRLLLVSAATRFGLDDLVNRLFRMIRGQVDELDLGVPAKTRAKAAAEPANRAAAEVSAKPARRTAAKVTAKPAKRAAAKVTAKPVRRTAAKISAKPVRRTAAKVTAKPAKRTVKAISAKPTKRTAAKALSAKPAKPAKRTAAKAAAKPAKRAASRVRASVKATTTPAKSVKHKTSATRPAKRAARPLSPSRHK